MPLQQIKSFTTRIIGGFGVICLFSVEILWLRCLILHPCRHVKFPSCCQIVIKVFPNILEKTKERCVSPTFTSCVTYTCSFDLWMSYVHFDTFAMVMNFINPPWEPTHVTIGIIELDNTIGATMENKIKNLLDSFGLLDKVIACVKDEGFNLNTLTFALTFMVSCSTF
jgi:hypothetical protein